MPTTLVVDDDQDFQRVCETCIGSATAMGEHRFIFAHSDEEALKIIQGEDELDIAIVSIDGGNISGMELFKKLEGVRLRVPRIALTGGRDLSSIRKAMNEGAADFLTKPVNADDLMVTVDKVFKDCEARREAWRNEAQLSAIKRELDIAENIQKQILPSIFPSSDHLEISAHLTPAKRMSGDFYDTFDLDDDKIGIAVADVSGKGIPAAFFMAVARTLLRATAMTSPSPAACLSQVNNLLCEHEINSMFVSVFYCVVDTKTWEVTYSNGGHLPPYLVSNDDAKGAIGLEGREGIVLGVQEDMPFENCTCKLGEGDAIFFYTDGVTEAFDRDKNQFSEERLIDYLLENRSLSAHSLSENLFAFVNDFRAGAEQNDDFTSLVLKRF
ncbi:putative Response regulator receiver modulated serine phosphatase [Candidatus Terasakiella magnetica]|uniref:Putative Response regulator receiver modulated serine phosphatase n=1 Tax=Candidatus Terasakiella magnetica TaxID=1867952 RepID=A0A1C3RFU9_9PROT|nr:SpoIIE family protein phosphatase [Candidatus Terasakiella magnetica]SCA56084.1 putative Response regulator receiver modulated serine phosphatase [Candidatus Terasakiella magnetica]